MDIFQISISCEIFEIHLHIKNHSLFIWNTNVTSSPIFLLNQATLPPAHDYSYSSILFIVLCLSTVGTRGKPYALHFSFSYSQQLPLNFILLLFSPSVVSDSLWPHGLQHARLPCPLPTPGVCSNSCPLNRWCHPTISSSVVPFSSCPQSFPALGSFPVSWLFALGGQSTGTSASASVLPVDIQGWFPSGLTGLISLQSKGLSRVFSSTTVQKHQLFGALPSL